MRALVISDSHHDSISINMVLKLHREAEMVIFLGDGEDDFFSADNIALMTDKKVVAVKGNCDLGSALNEEEFFTFGGKKVFALHGHTRGVKHTSEMLEAQAKKIGADIVVYGHTHNEKVEYIDKIYYMCPGSIRNGTYGIIDIDESTETALCYTTNLYYHSGAKI